MSVACASFQRALSAFLALVASLIVSCSYAIISATGKQQPISNMKPSTFIAVVFWTSILAMLVVETGLVLPWTQSRGFSALTTLYFAVLALGWVLAHSREHSVHVCRPLKIGIVAFAIVGVPYYKFMYFGAREGFRFIGILVLCLSFTIVLSALITNALLPDYVPQ